MPKRRRIDYAANAALTREYHERRKQQRKEMIDRQPKDGPVTITKADGTTEVQPAKKRRGLLPGLDKSTGGK